MEHSYSSVLVAVISTTVSIVLTMFPTFSMHYLNYHCIYVDSIYIIEMVSFSFLFVIVIVVLKFILCGTVTRSRC